MSQNAFEIAIEKCVSLLLVVFLLVILDWRAIMTIFIVLGQGHFLLAYYYQYKAGKIDRAFGIRYACCVIVLAAFYFLAFNHELLLLATAIFFLQHALFDELHLLRVDVPDKNPLTSARLCEMTPVFLLYTAMLIDGVLNQISNKQGIGPPLSALHTTPWFCLLSAVVLTGYSWRVWKRSWKLDNVSVYFFSSGLVLVLTVASGIGQVTPVIKLMGFIILYHYFNWYAYYFHKLSSQTSERRKYIFLALLTNGLLIGFYLAWHHGLVPLGAVLFSEDAFYCWTILHLVCSLRAADFTKAGSADMSG